MRLAMAHMDLAKAEASEIGVEVAKVAGLFGAAILLVIIAATLLVLGTSLFLGEWLLGSMGWGIVQGLEACVAVAITCILVALGVGAARIGRAILLGIVVGIVVALVLGTWVLNSLYKAIRDASGVAVDPASAPLLTGVIILGIVGLILGIVFAARTSTTTGNRVGIVIGSILVGAIVGALTAITYSAQVAAGIGITVGYAVWIVAMAMDVARTGIDMEALKLRFYPTATIETSKETLEWLQRRMPPGIG